MKKYTEQTTGVVTRVQTCWWLKINTKPVRTHILDGAVFPHIIRFTYTVSGQTYQGKRYISYKKQCPRVGERIAVYYSAEKPNKYAVKV